jgi:cytochrome c oxidase subunit 2
MLFNVKVVSQAEYDAQMQALRDRGQVGELNVELGRSDLPPTSTGSK